MPSLTRDDLTRVFHKPDYVEERIGIEVETAALDPQTGRSIPYEGNVGLGAFLDRVLRHAGGEPHLERGNLVAVKLPSSAVVSLENGGAVEYSSAPASNLATAVEVTRQALRELADIAASLGFALVAGANYPFTKIDDVHWMPNGRGDIMRRHFDDLGPQSAFGREVMGLTLSTQATFDYTGAADLEEKLHTQAISSTVAAALLVNSPLEGGRPCGALSRRMQYWSRIDPLRTRIIPLTIDGPRTVDRFVDWAVTLPMIYHKRHDGTCEPVGRSFAELLTTGFMDGSQPELTDWISHLSQIYTDVRLRNTLEVRAVDGPPWDALAAVPAFWTGLTYHRPARLAAIGLLGGMRLADHLSALDDIAVRGLDATFAGQPVHKLATELVTLSADGLRARVAAGIEPVSVLSYLDPLWEVLESGLTFAKRCLDAWTGELSNSPERYVKKFRI